MPVYFLAQLLIALMEPTVRRNMLKEKIAALPILPEGRASRTPTIEQIFGQLADCQCIHTTEDAQIIKSVRNPLTQLQKQLLSLLEVEPKVFA